MVSKPRASRAMVRPLLFRIGMRDRAAFAQGLYYVVTGLWPFLHLRSFLRVTGPKRDIWLVRTVGALAAAIGVPLLRSESPTLAATSAIAFGAVDAGYVAVGRISPMYLVDAAAQAGFLALRIGRKPSA